MVPIVINENQYFDDATFKEYLLKICRTHKDEQRALAFAFIVYDFADYTITKILKDEEYWIALDKIAGHYLSVFYVDSKNEHYKRRQQEIFIEQKRIQEKNSKKGISFLVPIELESTPLDKTIALIKNDFQIEEEVNHPFVIFFQSDGQEILDYFLVSLQQKKIEEAFLELKSLLQKAVEGINRVTPDNFENHSEIFQLLKGAAQSGKLSDFITKNISFKINIGTIIAIVKTIAGH